MVIPRPKTPLRAPLSHPLGISIVIPRLRTPLRWVLGWLYLEEALRWDTLGFSVVIPGYNYAYTSPVIPGLRVIPGDPR